MQITKFEHACFAVSLAGKKIIVDPGSFTVPLPNLDQVVAVVITHEHADHWTPEHLTRILEANPGVRIFGPSGVVAAASDFDITVVNDGETISVEPFELRFIGEKHAQIHSSIPIIDNVGVLINDTVFHPGDSFTLPPEGVPLLAVPSSGPWLKIGEVMDYILAAKPQRTFAMHEMVNSVLGQGMANTRIGSVTSQAGGEFVPLEPGDTFDL